MQASYDHWWDSLKGPIDLNEKAVGPKLNPFAELYWKQYGGGPTAEDYARMDPQLAFTFEANRAKAGAAKQTAAPAKKDTTGSDKKKKKQAKKKKQTK